MGDSVPKIALGTNKYFLQMLMLLEHVEKRGVQVADLMWGRREHG